MLILNAEQDLILLSPYSPFLNSIEEVLPNGNRLYEFIFNKEDEFNQGIDADFLNIERPTLIVVFGHKRLLCKLLKYGGF